MEGVGRDLLDNLPSLSKGQAIVAGSAVNLEVDVIAKYVERLISGQEVKARS